MKNKDNTITCVAALIGLILIPLIAILQGWVLTVLWGWFIVPTFRLPQISIAVAIGLTLIVAMFKTYNIDREEKSGETSVIEATAGVIIPLFLLFIGWIVHLFM